MMDEPRELNEILRTVVGSGLHGMAIEGTDDHDEMGIYVERVEQVVGLDAPQGSDVWRTKPEGVRSGPGDVDLVRYSLRHYMRLATQGNPTVLLPLFAPHEAVLIRTNVGDHLRRLAPQIVSKQAGPRFLGYMTHQIERLEGTRRSKPNRPELVEKYGYDTKFASHAARLAYQGIELMQTGQLTLPMEGKPLEWVMAIKHGTVTKELAIGWVGGLREKLVEAIETSDLRPTPDVATLNAWLVETHLSEWGKTDG